MTRTRKIIRLVVAGLFLHLAWGAPASATYAIPSGNTGQGTIESVNHAHHTITVDGQTYRVSPNAAYSGVGGFDGLTPGMSVEFVGNGPLNSGTAVLTGVIVVPGHSTEQGRPSK